MSRGKKDIVICSHVVFVGKDDVYGPAHAISSFLKLKKINHIYIKHSLYDSRPSIVERYKNNKKSESRLFLPNYFPGLLRHLAEIISTTFLIIGMKKVDIFIGANPLNAFSGILAKKMGKVNSIIFYTADYANNRFANALLNNLYHMLDRFVIKNADYVWNVSSKIREVRKKQGVDDKINIFVPNAPISKFITKLRSKKRKRRGLVLMANFTPAINYDLIVNVVADLKKKFSGISLSFIGTGVKEEHTKKLVKKLGLSQNIFFLGLMKHDDALREISKSSIGLAPYVSEWPWTAFGDSLKAREYAALGLPIIMNKGISTGDDIEKYKAGFVIQLNKKNLTRVLTKLLSDNKLYNMMKNNAFRMAREVDLEKVLNKHLLQKYNI